MLLQLTGEPDQPLQVGDLVLTGGLSSAEYNGFVGEVKSGLIDGRYQVCRKRGRGREPNEEYQP
jgi:cell shape-determining protein MreC